MGFSYKNLKFRGQKILRSRSGCPNLRNFSDLARYKKRRIDQKNAMKPQMVGLSTVKFLTAYGDSGSRFFIDRSNEKSRKPGDRNGDLKTEESGSGYETSKNPEC